MDFNYSDIQITRLYAPDIEVFIELIRVFEEVFEMKDFTLPDHAYLNDLLKREDFLVFVATKEGTVVGGLTIYVLHQYYSVKPLAYIYDLAVKKELQRKGIGKKLISAVKEYCAENGFEEVFVQADEVDDYALDFYRSTGITQEEKVRHFYYKLEDLSPK
jgi:aminoglycoside 3-N-acetyltransferase I